MRERKEKQVTNNVPKSLGEYTASALEHCRTADKPIRIDLVG